MIGFLFALAVAPFQVGNPDGYVFPNDVNASTCVKDKTPDPPLPKNVKNATWYNMASPPTRFQKDVRVRVSFQHPNVINRDEGPDGIHPDCNSTTFAYFDPDTRTLHLPNPCNYPQTDAYARLVCHEMGHVNGWPGYHGD